MEEVKVEKTFEEELKNLLNVYSKENSCNTPDFILAQYLHLCLRAFTTAVNRRDVFDENVERGPGSTNPLPASRHPAHELSIPIPGRN